MGLLSLGALVGLLIGLSRANELMQAGLAKFALVLVILTLIACVEAVFRALVIFATLSPSVPFPPRNVGIGRLMALIAMAMNLWGMYRFGTPTSAVVLAGGISLMLASFAF